MNWMFHVGILFLAAALCHASMHPANETQACKSVFYLEKQGSVELTRSTDGELYDNNLDCDWTILTPCENRIILSINFFDGERGKDYLALHDGNSDQASLTHKYDILTAKKTHFSSKNAMQLRFHSDDKNQKKKFRIDYFTAPALHDKRFCSNHWGDLSIKEADYFLTKELIAKLPWTVEIRKIKGGDGTKGEDYVDYKEYACTGTLVDAVHVVTTAHCLYTDHTVLKADKQKLNKEEIRVLTNRDFRLGHKASLKLPYTYKAQEIHIHEQYDPASIKDDIAIIKLDRKVVDEGQKKASPVCVLQPGMRTDPDSQLLYTTFGTENSEDYDKGAMGELAVISTKQVFRANKTCESEFNEFEFDPKKMICARLHGDEEEVTDYDSCKPSTGGGIVERENAKSRFMSLVALPTLQIAFKPDGTPIDVCSDWKQTRDLMFLDIKEYVPWINRKIFQIGFHDTALERIVPTPPIQMMPEGSCQGQILIDERGWIRPPVDENHRYQNNLYCYWTIVVSHNKYVRIEIADFESEKDVDRLQVYEESMDLRANMKKEISGNMKQVQYVEISNRRAIIVFVSNERINGRAFQLLYYEVQKLPEYGCGKPKPSVKWAMKEDVVNATKNSHTWLGKVRVRFDDTEDWKQIGVASDYGEHVFITSKNVAILVQSMEDVGGFAEVWFENTAASSHIPVCKQEILEGVPDTGIGLIKQCCCNDVGELLGPRRDFGQDQMICLPKNDVKSGEEFVVASWTIAGGDGKTLQQKPFIAHHSLYCESLKPTEKSGLKNSEFCLLFDGETTICEIEDGTPVIGRMYTKSLDEKHFIAGILLQEHNSEPCSNRKYLRVEGIMPVWEHVVDVPTYTLTKKK